MNGPVLIDIDLYTVCLGDGKHLICYSIISKYTIFNCTMEQNSIVFLLATNLQALGQWKTAKFEISFWKLKYTILHSSESRE